MFFILFFIILCFIVFLFCFGELRYLFFHFFQLVPLMIEDFIDFVRTPSSFQKFGIVMYCGYMGEGKTIKAVDDVLYYKKRFPNIHVYSNIHIACSYEPINSWQTIIDAPDNSIFLIDEVSSLIHARDWKNFPADLMRTMFQCRKNHKYMIMTAQRFHHVDKVVRDVTSKVYQQRNCFWRIHRSVIYDGFEMENTVNVKDLQPMAVTYWHRTNKMYAQYNTEELIDKFKIEDFISNDEIIQRQGIHSENLSNSYKTRKYHKRYLPKK